MITRCRAGPTAADHGVAYHSPLNVIHGLHSITSVYTTGKLCSTRLHPSIYDDTLITVTHTYVYVHFTHSFGEKYTKDHQLYSLRGKGKCTCRTLKTICKT
jgi:hypothetical protein